MDGHKTCESATPHEEADLVAAKAGFVVEVPATVHEVLF